ncbi:hypothetical protein FPV67DRAFT_1453802 [Lyophyllum atratum]|nr:hypothetical protein FPV67DRAFT_1453802 [Lyophyllum atratum]
MYHDPTSRHAGGNYLVGWSSTSIPRPPLKRGALTPPWIIPASYPWPSQWGPKYWRSFGTEIYLLLLSLATGSSQVLVSSNKQLEKGEDNPFETDTKWYQTECNIGVQDD